MRHALTIVRMLSVLWQVDHELRAASTGLAFLSAEIDVRGIAGTAMLKIRRRFQFNAAPCTLCPSYSSE